MESIKSVLLHSSTRFLVIATAIAFVAQNAIQAVLNVFYAKSLYPVPYYEGQLAFDASKIEGWLAWMIEHDTLGIYVQTQLVDFGFIVGVAAFHAFALALLARLLPAGGWRSTAVALIVVGVAAPASDVLENLASFVMLANPTDISPAVALVYSSFAAAKFACFAIVYAWMPVALVVAAVSAARARARRVRTA